MNDDIGKDGKIAMRDLKTGKVRRINPVDAKEWLAGGTGEVVRAMPEIPPEQPTPSTAAEYDWAKHSVAELRYFAKEAKLKRTDGMDKAELVSALIKADYMPSDEAEEASQPV